MGPCIVSIFQYTGWTQKNSLISSSYEIITYWNIAFHCPLMAVGGGNKKFIDLMYLKLMHLQLMYLQLMYLQLMYLQLMYLQLMYLQYHIYKNIPVSFDFITTWNQGVSLCSPCISNKMQRYTIHLYLETALHVSVGTTTHHQERVQLYLQHLVFVTPLLLSAAIAAGSNNGVTNTRCCRYSCMRSWWWMVAPPETCRAVSRYK